MTSDPQEPASTNPFLSLGEALRFLTIIPTPWVPASRAGDLVAAIPYFPAAGILIGGMLLAIGTGAGWLWPEIARAGLLVVAWAVLSGGLHLDGLSDSFDAIMSWRSRERKLEIMRDSRIGAMGTLAIVSVLLLKFAFLAGAGAAWWQAILVAPILGRWVMVYAILRFPSARNEGLGHAVRGRIGWGAFGVGSAATILYTGLIGGLPGLVAVVLAWAAAELIGRWWTRDLGGLTGDTYGALCELIEVVVLATVSV
jgi:adenosylcobinamide-GDP ribazoletransferase